MSNIVSPAKKLSRGDPSLAQLSNEIDSSESYIESASLYLKTCEEIQIQHLMCYKIGCQEIVFCECKCLAQATYICQTHVGAHIAEDSSKNHTPLFLDLKTFEKKWDKIVDYLENYNTHLKNLKKQIASKVTEHFQKINKDVDCLFKNIDEVISKNKQKIIDSISSSLKIIENLTQFQLNSLKEFTKKCDKIRISDECSDIIQAEISDWNATMTDLQIAKKPVHKIWRQLLLIDDYSQSLDINLFIKRLSDKLKPRLHWCKWQSNEVHYFDWNENTHKSVTINGLDIPRYSRSISIDHNEILLCGGWPDDNIPRTNENTLKVYKINLESQSFETLASMNTGRANHCMTYLNGYYYVLGGVDYQSHRIKKCERYTLENDRWEGIADLDHTRNLATCVSISKDNCIYIIGGKINLSRLDETIEKYDAALNNWTLIQIQRPILSLNLGCCLLPDSNFIFIFGGIDINGKCQKECYLYNYKTNQVTNANPISSEYNEVLNMPVISNNKVYCYFWKSNSESEGSIYDMESGVWA